MNIKNILLTVFISTYFISLSSCSDDDDKNKDTTDPIITINSPKNGDSFTRGKDIHIDFDLEDETGINQYKIDIHWGAKHTHKSSTNAELPAPVKWSYLKISDTEKEKKKVHVHVHSDVIPSNTELGEYHFGVHATDLVGNDSEKYISIMIVK